MKRWFLLLPVLLFGGCISLPPGEAPQGAIVKNQLPDKFTPDEAAEYLKVNFSVAMMQFFPGRSFWVTGDSATSAAAGSAAQEAVDMAGCTISPDADIVLRTYRDGNIWHAVIEEKGKTVWRKKFILK